MTSDWLTADQIAALRLPGLPRSRQGVDHFIDQNGYRDHPELTRPRQARGGGREYHYSILPPAALAALHPGSRPVAGGSSKARRRSDLEQIEPFIAEAFASRPTMPASAVRAMCLAKFGNELLTKPNVRGVSRRIPMPSLRVFQHYLATTKKRRLAPVPSGAPLLPALGLHGVEDGKLRAFIAATLEKDASLPVMRVRDLAVAKFGPDVVLYRQRNGEPAIGPMPSLRTFDRYVHQVRDGR